ncbi:unnamed protein product, partial [Amoebophrya sp. A120]
WHEHLAERWCEPCYSCSTGLPRRGRPLFVSKTNSKGNISINNTGYCLNPELINATDPRLWVTPVRREPLDENWYPFFRKMFRKFAK